MSLKCTGVSEAKRSCRRVKGFFAAFKGFPYKEAYREANYYGSGSSAVRAVVQPDKKKQNYMGCILEYSFFKKTHGDP